MIIKLAGVGLSAHDLSAMAYENAKNKGDTDIPAFLHKRITKSFKNGMHPRSELASKLYKEVEHVANAGAAGWQGRWDLAPSITNKAKRALSIFERLHK